MLQKKKFIYIKDPKLQRIRNTLRILIRLKIEEEENILYKRALEIRKSVRLYNDLTERHKQILNKIEKDKYRLHELLRKSIVVCSICETTEDHRIFIPQIKEWVCPSCHARTRDLYFELKEHIDKGGSPGDHDMKYYVAFLD